MIDSIDLEQERKEILKAYRDLQRVSRRSKAVADRLMIRKAFDVAYEAHKDMRRKSGEPFIFHPIAVAKIVAEEIGLGTTSIVCALLHDTVEDTEITLDDIEALFGTKVARIVDGLTKISGVFDQTHSIQAENFRKILMTLAEDVRVIFIKLADRLHNMRTLDSMAKHKQLKIASETLYMFAPLAHRLGLYKVKSELEDMGMKYTEPEIYREIEKKLEKTEAVRERFINRFILPIKRGLKEQGLAHKVEGRTKSVFSIWNKMRNKNIPFEEVYDLFAIRIVLDSPLNREKSDCWKVYSIVTDFYKPNPDRLRDWISTPRANGYESLHATVMSPTGKWVEVQIRTYRMHEIAEYGYAAHWKYKEASGENALDDWIRKIRETLDSPEQNALDFIDDFKLNLFAQEIFIFTPKGELRNMPLNSTALDFAFEIHTDIGSKCIGAKVNHRLVPLGYELKSGDQVEIITSNKQKPKEEWMNMVATAKAKSKLKAILKEQKKAVTASGKDILQAYLTKWDLRFTEKNITFLSRHYSVKNAMELFYRLGQGTIDLAQFDANVLRNFEQSAASQIDSNQFITNRKGKADTLVVGSDREDLSYELSPCCSAIPGDDIVGFPSDVDVIMIHRASCPKAVELLSSYGNKMIKATWTNHELVAFLAGIRLTGIDSIGVVNQVTQIISNHLNVNMRSINFESNGGMFEGKIMVFVHDTNHLNDLIEALKQTEGILTVNRIDK